MLSVIHAECHLCWVLLCWVSFVLDVIHAECRLYWVPCMLSFIYAEWHLCWVSLTLSVIYTKCHCCWVWHISHLCCVPLCLVSWLRLWPLVMKPFRFSSCLTFKKYVSTSVGPSPSKLPQLGPISRKMSLPIPGKDDVFRRVNDGAGWTRRRPTRRQANWSTANSSTGL